MNGFFLMFLQPVAAIWGIFVLLLIYARKKGLTFTREEKKSFLLLLLVFLGVFGWFVFFEDVNFIFDCRKETRRCDYYHSTIYNKKLRLAQSYDLTGINAVEIKTHKRRNGKYTTKTVYRIRFSGKDGGFEMPKDFLKEDAQKQAARAVSFVLTGISPRYVFKETVSDGSEKNLIVVIGLSISMIFAMIGVLTIGIKIFQSKKISSSF